MKISTTERKVFKECRRKWEFRNNYKPVEVQDNLYLGKGVHHALEKWYAGEEKLVKAFMNWCEKEREKIREANNGLLIEQEERIDEQKELGIGMLEHYKVWAEKNDSDYFTEVIDTERWFEASIPSCPGGVYCGVADGIVKDEYDRYWILEHKTAKRLSTDHLELDEQVVSYLWALQQEMDIEFEGVIYNILLKKVPTQPRELKNGGITKRKNIKTTYEVYKQALIDHYGSKDNVPWEDYKEILIKLDQQENPFFHRERVRKTQHEIKEIGERISMEYEDMKNANIYPNPSRDCTWRCSFQQLCIEMNKGNPIDYLLETNFERRD